ncbi:MAG: alpha/beta hydrolase [Paracoccus sp. (in: a-proteobacteria)]|uniref:alpha/beta fold hydrolase n=1 Tax=Paracoccus sp. TaxID=267 RepID=UPI0026E0F2BC|nr:alpha/beta hydrolase [Paracoccus sp. (in: a-proteobacteria)]MDO5621358.1 alpha/beta hydrolase [Paracoccus sp. (in: a-proteobacteria)]
MSGVHLRHWPGDPDRPALALHCMMGTASYWGPIAEGLAGRVDLRAFDFPGHGRSPAPDPAVDYHTQITRLAAAMIDRPVDLIGHSLGATVALRIAVAAPEAIRSLTLIEPTFFAAAPAPDGNALAEQMQARLNAGYHEDAARVFMNYWGGLPFDKLPTPMREAAIRQIPLVMETDPAMRLDSCNLLAEGRLEAIDAPVLLITGSDSPAQIHAVVDALAERLPDVGRASVPGAGHMVPITHPAEVAGLIAVNLERS